MICAAIPCGKVHKHWYSCGVPCGNLTIAIQNGPFGSLIYPLKMLIFYSFLYVYNRVNPLIEDDTSIYQRVISKVPCLPGPPTPSQNSRSFARLRDGSDQNSCPQLSDVRRFYRATGREWGYQWNHTIWWSLNVFGKNISILDFGRSLTLNSSHHTTLTDHSQSNGHWQRNV